MLPSMWRWGAWLFVAMWVSWTAPARAQADDAPEAPASEAPFPEPVPAAPPPAPSPEDLAPKDLAREYFMRGVALFEAGELDAALAEFRRSASTYDTRVASRNVAVCLQALGRHDEALEVLEKMLAASDLNAEWRKMLERDAAEATRRVGSIAVDVDVPGATVLVSGRVRGRSPLAAPIRVPSGSHRVRVIKEDHLPFETRVEVAGQQRVTVSATLPPLGRAGELRVIETSGRTAEVVVDQVVVGKTPWVGRLPPGTHTVTLRGEGDFGTQPASVSVREGAPTSLSLALEMLTGLLRIEPVPAGARMALDGVDLGHGVWEGRVRPGPHRVEVAADGFVTASRRVTVAQSDFEKLIVELERDPSSPHWAKTHPPRIVLDVDLGVALAPSFGGELGDACDDCSGGPAIGGRGVLRAGYQFGFGLGVYLDAGYLGLYQKRAGRSGTIFDVTRSGLRDEGHFDDELVYQALMVGAAAAYHGGDALRWQVRLGVGALVGTLADRRTGTFDSAAGSYTLAPYVEHHAAHFLYVAPEARIGYRVADPVELSVGVSGMIALNLVAPRWSDSVEVASPTPFLGRMNGPGAPATLAGHMLIVVPAIGARFEF